MASRINELELYVSNRGEENQSFDWTKAASSLTSGIATVSGMRSARRAENEQFKKSAETEVAKDLNLTNKTYIDTISYGASTIRSKINELYNAMQRGEISRTKYKSSVANIKDYWTSTSEYIKGVDTKYAEAIARQQTNDPANAGSGIEIATVDYFGRLNDLGNKAFAVDDDGRISLAVFNDKKQPIGYQDIKSLNNLMGVRYDKFDLPGSVSASVKNWAENQNYSLTDIRTKPELFEQGKDRVVGSIMSNPRAIGSILVDYGGFAPYFSDADKTRALEELRLKKPDATEDDLVLFQQNDDGQLSGKYTPAQIKAAQVILDREIEQEFGTKRDYAPGYGSGGGSGSGDEDKQKKTDSLWKLTYDSFNSLTTEMNRDAMATKLTAATGGDVIFSPNPKGNGYIAQKSNGEILVEEDRPLVHPKDVWVMIGEVTGNNKMTRTRWEELYGNSGLREVNINKKKRNAPKNASAGTFLNWATEGSTVDYGSK
jgi:hypothetical protein